MFRPFPFLLLVFCTWSLPGRAGIGRPHTPIRFNYGSITPMITDSVPGTRSPKTEKKEEPIKEVPKARKQVKPVPLTKIPASQLPIVKPVIKPVIRPVIKPVIRIH
ncbi:MAG: hypothetical protein Q8939_13105 [Bacteroidota bacterium]|nr:hypothetical protein [Bacteroidota bacterium]MDP4211635.1 hypothetical protein [Bacteroidota bacterium]